MSVWVVLGVDVGVCVSVRVVWNVREGRLNVRVGRLNVRVGRLDVRETLFCVCVSGLDVRVGYMGCPWGDLGEVFGDLGRVLGLRAAVFGRSMGITSALCRIFGLTEFVEGSGEADISALVAGYAGKDAVDAEGVGFSAKRLEQRD